MMRFLILFIVFATMPIGAGAQAIPSPDRGEVSLEYLKPHFNSDAEVVLAWLEDSYLTSSLVVAGRYPVTEHLWILVDLPISHVSGRANSCVDARCMKWVHGTILNNPLLGVEWKPGSFGLSFDGGIRLPLQRASWLDDHAWNDRWDGVATGVGVYGDAVDRLEMYLPDVTSLSVRMTFEQAVTGRLGFRFFARPVVMYHPSGEGYLHERDGEKYEVHLHYGGSAYLGSMGWTGHAGMTVRSYNTASSPLKDRAFRQGFGALSYRFGSTEASGEIRVPFGHVDSRDIVDWSFLCLLKFYFE